MLKTKNREQRMPYPKAIEVILSEEEQTSLEQLVRRHNVGQQIALRARIILAAGQGRTSSRISRELKVSINTAQRWRNRFAKAQTISYDDLSLEDRLQDGRVRRPARMVPISARIGRWREKPEFRETD
jgi:hypothetical protein